MKESEQYIQGEQEADLEYLKGWVHVLQAMSKRYFEDKGRRAVVVDSNHPPDNQVHEIGFFDRGEIDNYRDNEAIVPMLEQYNPENEVVIILVKDEEANAYWLKIKRGGIEEVKDSVFAKHL